MSSTEDGKEEVDELDFETTLEQVPLPQLRHRLLEDLDTGRSKVELTSERRGQSQFVAEKGDEGNETHPPWLESTTPCRPASAARTASLQFCTPLRTIGILVIERNQGMS